MPISGYKRIELPDCCTTCIHLDMSMKCTAPANYPEDDIDETTAHILGPRVDENGWCPEFKKADAD